MTRHESVAARWPGAGLLRKALAAPAALLLVLAGCGQFGQFGQFGQQRGKLAEEAETARYDVPTVGDKTVIGNAEPTPLGGVGLVEGLEGTGGDCPHDSYRTLLADNLRKQGEQHANQLLTSTDCALVIVEARWPAGASKGDKIDIEVKIPPGSRATSLRGGVLRKCFLFNYDFARNLKPDYNGSRGMMMGHKVVIAEGPVLTTAVDGEEATARQGRIWQGGKSLLDHPLALVMNPDSQQARFTSLITERINGTFQANTRTSLDSRPAHTTDNMAISLRVPPQYRHNLPRYFRIVRTIPLGEVGDLVPKEGDDKRSYRQKLADDLLDPARTIVAALRLESLGMRSVPALKAGLKHPHPLVRFSSAEALAYLGSSAGCEGDLGRAAARYPVLRAYALSALASLDEGASQAELKKLITSEYDDDVRAGAFRALHLLNERDPAVQGEHLNQSFWMHRVAAGNRSLIHVSTTQRAEVVLFGPPPALRPPFSLLAGEYQITASSDSTSAVVSRVPLRGAQQRKVCSLEIEDVIRTMTAFGAGFSEVLTILQQANGSDAVAGAVRFDALPQPGSVHELATLGRDATGQSLLPAGAKPAAVEGAGGQ